MVCFVAGINGKRDIKEEIAKVDLALLDGTFLRNGELPNRDMSAIPHPFIEESMSLFATLPAEEKQKVIDFILKHYCGHLKSIYFNSLKSKAKYG